MKGLIILSIQMHVALFFKNKIYHISILPAIYPRFWLNVSSFKFQP